MKVSWDDSSQYMESHTSHVPNHQPDVEPITLWDVLYTSVPRMVRMEVSLTLLGCLRQDREPMRWPCHVADMGHMGFLWFSLPTNLHINLLAASDLKFTIHFNVGSCLVMLVYFNQTLFKVTANDTRHHKPSPTTVQSQKSHF